MFSQNAPRLALWLVVFVGLVPAALSAATAYPADLVVVASDAPTLRPGRIVRAEEPIDIPGGASVTLVSETGAARTLDGPYNGPAGPTDRALAGNGDGRLVASLAGLLASGRETLALGATRAAGARPEPADPWAIDIGLSGTQCVPAAGPVRLWRGRRGRPDRLVLKDLDANTRSVVPWPAGVETLDWPAALPLRTGGRYLARFKGAGAAGKLILRRVPAGLPTDAHRAAWMAEIGCRDQARRLLARLR